MFVDISKTMTADEVAKLFCVKKRTVSTWAREGKIPSIKTPGGQYRYIKADVYREYLNTYISRGWSE